MQNSLLLLCLSVFLAAAKPLSAARGLEARTDSSGTESTVDYYGAPQVKREEASTDYYGAPQAKRDEASTDYYSAPQQNMYKVMNAVQAARRTNVETQTISALMADLDDCLKGVLQERNADQYKGLFRDMANRWSTNFSLATMKPVVPTKTTLSGRTWDKPDYADANATYRVKATPAQVRQMMKDLPDDELAYFKDSTTAGGKHKAPMVSVQTIKNTFLNPGKGGCIFPTT
ncbi:hypothetical protein SCUP515_07039 [Seiridium cupressi]